MTDRDAVGKALGDAVSPVRPAGKHRRPNQPIDLRNSGVTTGRHRGGPGVVGVGKGGGGNAVDDGAGRLAADLYELSGGNIIGVRPNGPVFAARAMRRPAENPGTFVHVLSPGRRAVVAALSAGWVLALVVFWLWWLQPSHRMGWQGFLVNTVLIAYLCVVPLYYLVAVNRLREVHPALPVPPVRVALVVTRAPTERWPLVRRTLVAMLEQDFPYRHDVWLCDEDPSAEVAAWCADHGVQLSTRRGIHAYHRSTWPRRTKCKEGNLAYFYDRVGYRDYDVVSQLDADHIPSPTYLREMVRPFADPAIGYVAAPSVCDTNAGTSWSARGRLHREATFHGPLQLGHNAGLGPVCIGSHYAVRTRALRSIGGIGPELAEDFSTAYLLNVAGWSGAFAIGAHARGEGPNTFAAMLTQEFQWSRSLCTLLYDLVPRTLHRLPWRLRVRFLFALSYYPLLTVSTGIGVALPAVAAATGQPWVRVDYLQFLLHWFALSLALIAVTLVVRGRGLLRPAEAPIISWELFLYVLARWLVVGWGLLAASLQKLIPRSVVFTVTPKGMGGLERMPTRLVAPYLVVSMALSCAAIWGELYTGAVGYIGLSLLGATAYSAVGVGAPLLHVYESARTSAVPFRAALSTAMVPLLVSAIVVCPLVLAIISYPGYLSRELGT